MLIREMPIVPHTEEKRNSKGGVGLRGEMELEKEGNKFSLLKHGFFQSHR